MFNRFDQRVHSAAQYLSGYAQRITLHRVERNVRRERERKRIHDSIDDDWSVLVRKGFSKSLPNVAGLFDANAIPGVNPRA